MSRPKPPGYERLAAKLSPGQEQQSGEDTATAEARQVVHDEEGGEGEPTEVGTRYRLTDTGNAERFAAVYRDTVRYVAGWRLWTLFDGKRWAADEAGTRVEARVKLANRRIYAEAAACENSQTREAIGKWAKKSEARGARDATLRLARSEAGMVVSHEQLDADPMLLTVENGTLDLRTGKLRAHRREDLITNLAPVVYDPEAQCPMWENFLADILDAETVAYLKRAVGYSLTGQVSEQCLFFCYGKGANGKTTFLNAVLEMLGPHAGSAPSGILMAKPGEAHPTELTVLFRRRFVVAQETEQGRRLAESTLKQLTGGDQITARRMREDFWTFDPTHKLWIAGNYRPTVRGTDEGIWRRLRLIPFVRVIPADKRDATLPARLRPELPGILRWAVEGCIEWQHGGLRPPATVTAATEEYRADSDRLGPFLEDRCELDPHARVTGVELYNAFLRWCSDTGDSNPLGRPVFGELLCARDGITRGKVGAGSERGWHGVRLLLESEWPRRAVTRTPDGHGRGFADYPHEAQRSTRHTETASESVRASASQRVDASWTDQSGDRS